MSILAQQFLRNTTLPALQSDIDALIASDNQWEPYGTVFRAGSSFCMEMIYGSAGNVITSVSAQVILDDVTLNGLSAKIADLLADDSTWQPNGMVFKANGKFNREMIQGTTEDAALQEQIDGIMTAVMAANAAAIAADGHAGSVENMLINLSNRSNYGGPTEIGLDGAWAMLGGDVIGDYRIIAPEDSTYGPEIKIVNRTDFPHTVKWDGEFYDGSAGGPYNKLTFPAFKGGGIALRFEGSIAYVGFNNNVTLSFEE